MKVYENIERAMFIKPLKVKAIYFDLDNTLVDRRASIDRFAEVFVHHFERQLNQANAEVIAERIQQIDCGGYLPSGSGYKKISQAIAGELYRWLDWVVPISETQLEAFWREQFPQCTVVMSGALETLTRLTERGFHLGIISNGSLDSREKTVAATPFSNFIQQLVSSGQFGQKKPHPEIFLSTLEAAGFKPSQCLYVGDHPVNDIQGALSAGLHAVWLKGFHEKKNLPKGAISIESLPEILNLVCASHYSR